MTLISRLMRVYGWVFDFYKPSHIPLRRVYERVFGIHKPSKGFMQVQRIANPFRVYESQIPSHIPFRRVYERVYENQIPIKKPL